MNNNTLPENWLNVHLGSIIDYGKSDKAQPHEICDDTWVLELEDIEKNSSKILKKKYFLERQSKSTKNKFNKGDILYGKLRPYLNKVVIADESGVCTTEIVPIKCNELLNNEFIFFWLKSPFFLNYVTRVGHGVNMPRLGTEDGKKAPFVLPPLAEQKEIARLLQQYFAKVEQTKSHLKAIPKLLTTFRQSVLADAVSGKLKSELIEANVFKDTLLNELILDSKNGISKRKGEHGDLLNVLRLADFSNAKRIYGNERQINLDKKEAEKYSLKTDDILVIRVNGSEDLAGKFIHYTEVDKPEAFCDHLIRLRLDVDRILPAYLLYITNIGHGRNYLRNSLSTSAGQNTINQTSIKNLRFKLPPLQTQFKIVERVEELFAFADNIERQVQSATEHVNLLTQSILAKAFRGELTADWREQNPELISGDNSAEALLARIQAQMKSSKAKTKAMN